MALHLDGALSWARADGDLRPLPVTLPVALLLVLARRREWMPRSALMTMFWPEADAERAQLNLRVNLHKARALLKDLRIDVPIETDRRGLRWAPPVQVGVNGAVRGPLASGFEISGFERFDRWLRGWREACGGAAGRVVAGDTDDEDDLLRGVPLSQRF